MRHRWVFSLCLTIFVLVSVPSVVAQDAPPSPPDNLCDAGQAWDDGRCQIPQFPGATELAWECGWYLARVRDGRLSTAQVPEQCRHLLQTLVEICKSETYSGEGWTYTRELCLRSDQTGTDQSFGDYEPIPPYQLRFVEDLQDGAGCPEVAGYILIYWGETVYLAQKLRDGFSSRDLFEVLNLLPYYCVYSPIGFPI